MSNCKECGRPLNQGGDDLCPACMSTKSHKKKRWTEYVVGAVAVVGTVVGVAISIFTGGEGGGDA